MVGTPACVRTGPGDGEQLVCWSVGGLTGSFLCSQVTEETMAYHPKPRGIHRCRLNAEPVDAERNPRLAFPQVLPPGTCSLFVQAGHPLSCPTIVRSSRAFANRGSSASTRPPRSQLQSRCTNCTCWLTQLALQPWKAGAVQVRLDVHAVADGIDSIRNASVCRAKTSSSINGRQGGKLVLYYRWQSCHQSCTPAQICQH